MGVGVGSVERSASIEERIHCPVDAMDVYLNIACAHGTISWLRVGVWKPNFWPKILAFPSISYLVSWGSDSSTMK